MSAVEKIVSGLVNHSYPSNMHYIKERESFPIYFNLSQRCDIFQSINSGLNLIYLESLDHLPSVVGDQCAPQFILKYKFAVFKFSYEFYDINAELDERFHIKIFLTAEKVKLLLEQLIRLNINIFDVNGNKVY